MTATKTQQEITQELVELYGYDTVAFAITLVEVSDADGAYTHFGDLGWWNHQNVVEELYFNN